MEIWESVYQNNKKMWGPQAAEVTASIMELFKELGLNKILIPGYGYGRNAQVFIQNGFDVTGIEISQTAINIAKEKLENLSKSIMVLSVPCHLIKTCTMVFTATPSYIY